MDERANKGELGFEGLAKGELDEAIEAGTIAQGLELGGLPRQAMPPTGDCPICLSRDTVGPTDDGARCALCKTKWVGVKYAEAMEAGRQREKKRYQLNSKPYHEPEPFAQYVALAKWAETPEGKKTLKVLRKAMSGLFSPPGDEWKDE